MAEEKTLAVPVSYRMGDTFLSYRVDFSDAVFSSDPTVYDHTLARMSLGMALSAYRDWKDPSGRRQIHAEEYLEAAGFSRLKTDYALAISCDMPLFRYPVLKPLLEAAQGQMAIIPVVKGRRQPLAGLYHRDLLPTVEAALQRGDYKIGQVVDSVPHKLVELGDNDAFFNVNRPADFRLVQGRLVNDKRQVPLVTVSAPKSNTGKTTFIERLIPKLKERGLRVGVVKGDCHGYDVDEEGKDSYRFKQAGADGVAVGSPEGYFIQQKTEQRASLMEIAGRLTDVDLVIIESRNHGTIPKISLWRGLGEVIADEDTVAIFSSGEHGETSLRQYDIDDAAGAVQLVCFLCGL
jgi:molybdopterin-guanine dinucleotide biosynthesis protein